MDLETLAKEMRKTAIEHPFYPSFVKIEECHPATERDAEIEGCPMRFIFTKNIFDREQHGFSGEFWHLSVSDHRRKAIAKPLVERILKAFFDPDKHIEHDSTVPGVAMHFSQVLGVNIGP